MINLVVEHVYVRLEQQLEDEIKEFLNKAQYTATVKRKFVIKVSVNNGES